ncbi:type I polyketide synthase, partial [Streptomyces sp. NPDC088116]|uniref:type I polyketide synthase n=1 Tax=Streptomyces sp. NPDC088116 TaxID=3365825 RepID=UPI0037FBBB26
GLIDLPPHPQPHHWQQLTHHLTHNITTHDTHNNTHEDQLAIRTHTTHARRMTPAPPPTTPTTPWKPQGTTLITGGTGALGTHIARWLAHNGAKHLILTSRQGPHAPGATQLQQELQALGTHTTITPCDITNPTQTTNLINHITTHHPPLRNIIHTAGTPQTTPLTHLTPTQATHILHAKTTGADLLHQLTQHTPLDTFILFSSGAATWGSGGQSLYAAANAHLDALAQQRHTHHQPATSIAWGVWGGTGMVELAPEGYLEQRGLNPLRPETALAALQQALDDSEVNLTVADLDWERFVPTFTASRPSPLISNIPQAAAAIAATRTNATGGYVPAGQAGSDLVQGRPEDRPAHALELVREHIAEVLGHPSAARIDPHTPFRELGFDSLAAVRLRGRLAETTGLELPTTLVFDHTDPAELADHLAGLVQDKAAGHVGRAPQAEGTLLATFRTAVAQERSAEAMELLASLAGFRPVFTGAEGGTGLPAPVNLASGPARPRLYCCAGTAPTSSPLEYARFAAGLRGGRGLTVLPLPGFDSPAQPLPASLPNLLAAQADALLEDCAGEPFALAGHSAGANIAHALAAHLEARGAGPAAVVLMDVYPPDDPGAMGVWRDDLLRWSLERSPVPLEDHRLTAMAGYHRLLLGNRLTALRAPVLLVRAGEPLREWPEGGDRGDWRSAVPFARTVADVPGNHFTMLTEHAEHTASVVHDWLSTISRAEPADPTEPAELTQSSRPSQPTEPVELTQPNQPSQTTEFTEFTKSTKSAGGER